MSSGAVLGLTRHEGVVTLTLARPSRGNALASDLVEAMRKAIGDCHADASVHTLVFQGSGRHFCTGLDLSDLEDCSDGELLARLVHIEQLLDMVWRSPLRTIAIAQGRTWGAGADLFTACETRIAHPDVTFRFPGARFGIVLGSRRLAERIGVDEARRVVINGLELDAQHALSMGLISALAQTPGSDAEPVRGLFMTAPRVDGPTARALRAATRPQGEQDADADLAALVRSAARPGLKSRMQAYLQALQSTR